MGGMTLHSRCCETCTHETDAECIAALRAVMRARIALPAPTLPYPLPERRTRPSRRRSPEDAELLTVAQVARLTQMTRPTIYKWLREGTVSTIWLPNGRRRIHRNSVVLLVPPDVPPPHYNVPPSNKKADAPEVGTPAHDDDEEEEVTSS